MLKISVVILCLILICESYFASALPICEKTEIPKRLIARSVINIVYTMESSCKMCVQQASRLPKLKRYLEKRGIKTHIIIGVSHKADRLSGLVPHIQVNSRHVWRALGEQNNNFYVIDRCGRLIYEIINPWSNLDLPFVKAGIAATAYSHPCGLCPEDYTYIPKVEEIQEFPPMENYEQTLLEDISPLKINVKLRHTHRGDPNIYNYIVKALDRPNYHAHHPHDKPSPHQGTTQRLTSALPLTTEVTHTSEAETQLDILSSTMQTNEESESSTLSSNTDHEESSLIISTRLSHSTESSSLILNKLQQSIHSTTDSIDHSTASSISYTLSSNNQDMASTKESSKSLININLSSTEISNAREKLETSTEISNAREKLETNAENIQEESTPETDETQSEDYNYDDYTSDETKEELTDEQEIEHRSLKAHYRRVLDWVDIFRDYNYD